MMNRMINSQSNSLHYKGWWAVEINEISFGDEQWLSYH